jgi:3-hydroxyacyl-CoA dehydrogenase
MLVGDFAKDITSSVREAAERGSCSLGENATGRKPNVRYSSLADKMCDKGWFGQKTQKGWYNYDPASPRKPLESPEALALIENHRKESVGPFFLTP